MNYFVIGIIILFVIGCIGSSYYFYINYKKNQKEKQYVENKEFLKKVNSVKGQFYFFYTKWCPYSKKAEPIWNKIKKNPIFSDYKIDFISIDCEDPKSATITREYKIKEYPSYILVVNNQKYIYDTNLHPESLERFFKAVYKKIN